MRIHLLFLIAAPFLQAQLAETTEPSYWRFAHPNAELVAGMNWKAIDGASSSRSQWRAVGEMLGHVDRLLVSSPVSGEPGRAPEYMLVIATGRFDLAQLQKAAAKEGAISVALKGAFLLGSPKPTTDEVLLAYIDPSTALIGTKQVISEALDRGNTPRRGPLSEKNDLFGTASAMAGLNDFWVVSNVDESSKNDAKGLYHGMNAYGAGFKLADGVQLSLHMNVTSEQLAKESLNRLGPILTQMDKHFPGVLPVKPGLGIAELLAPMVATVEDADVHAWSHVTSAQLALIRKKQAPLLASTSKPAGLKPSEIAPPPSISNPRPNVPMAVVATTSSIAPPPPVKRTKVVRIEGLEDGVRLIPYGGGTE